MRKSILTSIVLLPLLIISLAIYAMSTDDIEGLVVCAANDETSYIPSSACEFYLFNFRLTEEDIKYLESRSGLSFLFGIADHNKKYKFLEYFVAKGVSVNRPSAIDGLPPLHAAILENDEQLVEFLLQNGADPEQKDNVKNLTAEEFVDFLVRARPSIDRREIKDLLAVSDVRSNSSATSLGQQ